MDVRNHFSMVKCTVFKQCALVRNAAEEVLPLAWLGSKNLVKPIAQSPSEWHSRIRITDWLLVWALQGVLSCLNLTRHFTKFNSSSSARGCHVNLSCKRQEEQLEGHQTGTSFNFQDRLYGHLGVSLLWMFVWGSEFDLTFAFIITYISDSEVVGKETYCPYLLVTIEDYSYPSKKHPKVCDSPVCSGQFVVGDLLETNGRVNLPM